MTVETITIDRPLTWGWFVVPVIIGSAIACMLLARKALWQAFRIRREIGASPLTLFFGTYRVAQYLVIGVAGAACLVFVGSELVHIREVRVRGRNLELRNYAHFTFATVNVADIAEIIFVKDNRYNGYGRLIMRSGRTYDTVRIKDPAPVNRLKALVFDGEGPVDHVTEVLFIGVHSHSFAVQLNRSGQSLNCPTPSAQRARTFQLSRSESAPRCPRLQGASGSAERAEPTCSSPRSYTFTLPDRGPRASSMEVI